MKEKFTRLMLPLAVVFTMALMMTGALNAAQDGGQVAVDSETVTVQDVTSDPSSDVVGRVSDDVQRLIDATGGTAKVRLHRATGVLAFARFQPGSLALSVAESASAEERASVFFSEYGAAFGIGDANTELSLIDSHSDNLGMTHLTYQQVYRGVPVWAAMLRAHFNAENELTAVNGVFVPKVRLNVIPMLNESAVAGIAVADVVSNPHRDADAPRRQLSAADLEVASNQLVIYHDGLAQGVTGANHLVYEVEVRSSGVREFVYVNAHSGAVLDRMSAIHDALYRVIYEEAPEAGNIVWEEGDAFPGTLNEDQQNLVEFTGDSYYLFWNAFAADSYDSAGSQMQTVNNDPGINCPNAIWNGSITNYCNGVTSDDVVAHEWGHAYTQFTHGLIYRWQSGALNESYSDIWGEVVDQLNRDGSDDPNTQRTVGVCSEYMSPPAVLTIHDPAAIADTYEAQPAVFGPSLTVTGTMGNITIGDDGDNTNSGSTTDACEPLVNGDEISGTIALVDRGSCAFTTKVFNAQNAGAIGVVVANSIPGPPIPMVGSHPSITIPSEMIGIDTALLIKNEIMTNTVDVNITISFDNTPREDSYRWLMGEDSTALGEAARDMWEPTCKADPGKVTDEEYHCAPSDAGGVHSNSGVPNHGFTLLVDGGTYNGQTINAIGMVKAAHIYWRAQAIYQTETSYFPDHADALEASCSDLMTAGTDLEGLSVEDTPVGASGEVIMQADCDAVAAMIEAVEFHTDPTVQCAWQPILQQEPPALCADMGGDVTALFEDDFEGDPLATWTLTNTGVYTEYVERDWLLTDTLPLSRTGTAFFAINSTDIGNCILGDDDQSGVMYLDTPMITIPDGATTPRISFDHNVATEGGWDGGNLHISVNGGDWQVITETHFIYNAYNGAIIPAAGRNTNPLEGQPAFTGSDGGELFSIWGQSQIDLSGFAQPGDMVQIRFALGVDGCNGLIGWYVDDVNVHSCTASPTAVDVAQINTTEPSRRIPLEMLVAGMLLLSVGVLFIRHRKRGTSGASFGG